ncbi:MAG: helix-turn-helix domain-containing protein [Solirubrobacterales bacterium]
MSPVAAPSKELKAVVDSGISADQLARLTGRSERTARRWLAGETEPRGAVRRQLAEISAVLEEYSKAFPGGNASSWIERPNPELDFHSAAELIAEGRTREVLGLLVAIGEGVYL